MSAWPDGLPARVPAEDRGEIEELYARYAWGIDLADAELALSTFAEDAWFDHLWQGRVQGRDAIRKNLESLWYDRQHWWYGRQHLFNHFIMEPMEEGARVRCFFQIIQFNVDYASTFVFGIGTRDDLLTKRDGRWVFQSLSVNAWRGRDDVPWKGEVTMAERPSVEQPAAKKRKKNA